MALEYFFCFQQKKVIRDVDDDNVGGRKKKRKRLEMLMTHVGIRNGPKHTDARHNA